MSIIKEIEAQNQAKLQEGKELPEFQAGDTVRVHVKVVEGERTRTQPFEGVVIGKKNRGINSTFRVRKISYGEGVERVFSTHSPNITIELVRRGVVRRSKLYYLRDRSGKSARIAEKMTRAVPKESKLEKAAKPKSTAVDAKVES